MTLGVIEHIDGQWHVVMAAKEHSVYDQIWSNKEAAEIYLRAVTVEINSHKNGD